MRILRKVRVEEVSVSAKEEPSDSDEGASIDEVEEIDVIVVHNLDILVLIPKLLVSSLKMDTEKTSLISNCTELRTEVTPVHASLEVTNYGAARDGHKAAEGRSKW